MKMPSLGFGQLGRINRMQRVTQDIERANYDAPTLLRMMRTAPTPATAISAGAVYLSRYPETITQFMEALGPEDLAHPPHRVMLTLIGLSLFSTDVLETKEEKCES